MKIDGREIKIAQWVPRDIFLSCERGGSVYSHVVGPGRELIVVSVLARFADMEVQRSWESFIQKQRQPEARWCAADAPPELAHLERGTVIRLLSGPLVQSTTSLATALEAWYMLGRINELPGFMSIDAALCGAARLFNESRDHSAQNLVEGTVDTCRMAMASIMTKALEMADLKVPMNFMEGQEVNVDLAIDENFFRKYGNLIGDPAKDSFRPVDEKMPAIDIILRCYHKQQVA